MDVTRSVFSFAEARHLWNMYFANQVDSIMDRQVDSFLEIGRLLFETIVLHACSKDDYELTDFGVKPISFLHVSISSDVNELDILASRSRHPTKWEKRIIKREDWAQKKLFFIDFFDWYPQDPLGRCSYPFIEVEAGTDGERWLLPNEYLAIHCT